MKSVKLFWRDGCPRCPAAKQLSETLRQEGMAVVDYNMDTVDGLAEGAFHSVMALPTMLLVDVDDDSELAEWRGDIPSLDEIKQSYRNALV